MLGGGHNICCGNRGAWCLILLAIAIVVPHQGSNAQSVAPDLVLCVGACNNPTDVAIDPVAGYLYIVDQAYNRVLRYPPVGTLTASSQPEAVFGQADFLGVMANRGGLPSGDTLSAPYGAFVDSAGTLWIADTVNNRVLWFLGAALRSNGTSADGVLGQPNFTSNNPSLGPAGMRKPTSVQVDQNDTLWVSDSANNRVLRFPGASALTNGSSAFSVLGQPDMQSNSSGVSPASLNGPSRVAVASDGHLFLCDNHNQRVVSQLPSKTKHKTKANNTLKLKTIYSSISCLLSGRLMAGTRHSLSCSPILSPTRCRALPQLPAGTIHGPLRSMSVSAICTSPTL